MPDPMIQLLLHLVGDYWLQTQWMAENKVKRHWPALVHALVYSLPFLLVGSAQAWAVIFLTHVVIDRYSLAKYGIFAKNWLRDVRRVEESPFKGRAHYTWTPWSLCKSNFGMRPDVPRWLSFPVYVACDNTLHLAINYAALRWL